MPNGAEIAQYGDEKPNDFVGKCRGILGAMSRGMNNDNRNQCQFCQVRTWSKDYVAFMRDHDREDGRRCLRAANVYAPKINIPAWAKEVR